MENATARGTLASSLSAWNEIFSLVRNRGVKGQSLLMSYIPVSSRLNSSLCADSDLAFSVTATKTGQAPAESHVKRIYETAEVDIASYELSNGSC